MPVVRGWVIGAAIVVAPAIAAAQQPSRAAVDELIRNRQNISMIEGMFERAVQNGVDNFSRRLQEISPNADGMAMLMGAPQVRGFRLPQGGIIFDVQMPSLQLSMVWPLRYAQGADAATTQSLAELRSTLQQVSDPQMRAELSQKLRDIEQQMAESSALRRRTAGMTAVSTVQTTAAPAPPVSPADMAILDDPAEAWRSEVRSTLIDALIQHTGGVTVGPEELIIIAARGVLSPDRLVADPGASRTIELSLKGSDLAAFRAGALSLEDARKRVTVREY